MFVELPHWNQYHSYQLCYWYCLEIEYRQHLYAQMFQTKGRRTVDVELPELNRFQGVNELLESLDVEPISRDCWKQFQQDEQQRNRREEDKEKFGMPDLPGDLTELEREVVQSVTLKREQLGAVVNE
ncbi:MAG: hypothetical protein ABEK50_01250 [bacterium]